jgi:hypothetical protein
MKVTIELFAGADHREMARKSDIDKNIGALERAIDGKSICSDFIPLIDTKFILTAIREKLPE